MVPRGVIIFHLQKVSPFGPTDLPLDMRHRSNGSRGEAGNSRFGLAPVVHIRRLLRKDDGNAHLLATGTPP